MQIELPSDRLYVIEIQENRPGFAKTVTCRFCGERLFDHERDREEKLGVFFHGLKAHFAIQHEITLVQSDRS